MADVSTFEERQLLEQAQEWLEDADGHLQFHHMTVVYRVGSQLFRAIVKSRLPAELIKDTLAELHGTPFSLNDVLPIYPSHLKRALDASAMGWFVKQPRLLDIAADGGTRHVKELLLHEASIYEILESSPHPNVGRYHGCLVRDGRITGLCLTKYEVTLHDEIARTKQPFDPVPILEGIQSGLKHLHDLSLVHNDINPHNVMFAAGDDRPESKQALRNGKIPMLYAPYPKTTRTA
ncbi:MAG: hypothetical protein M1826_006562 [Phylliscum demangeonii]|nr:MAG: hypothetical protein M1826_006562 [Phylliscum demangeonii]